MLQIDGGRASGPDRLRSRAIRTINAGPAGVLPVLVAVALVVGAAGLLLLELGSAPGPQPGLNEAAKWALVALLAAGFAGLALAVRLRARDRAAETEPAPGTLTAVMLATCGLLPALLVPIHYLAARTHPPAVHWLSYGFLDKRWLTTTFLLASAGAALLLVLAARLVSTARENPASWREWLGAMLPAGASGDGAEAAVAPRRWWVTGLKLLCALLVASYFFAPPWNLPSRPLDYHETLMMGGVQGIRTGSLPFLDAASVQYGPGSELLNYAWTTVSGHESADGFRETTLIFCWLAVTIFLGVLYTRVRPLVAAGTTVAAFTVFPALQTFVFNAHGNVHGFWGWSNLLRYAGVFLLAMLFPAIVTSNTRQRRRRAGALALGLGWGALCVIAQENLIGGVLVLTVLAALLVLTDTARRRAVAQALAGIAAGLVVVAVPVCIYYLANGRLGRFLELYWLVPGAVASGYSNTSFPGGALTPYFIALPILLIGLLLASLLATGPLRVATRWSRERVLLVSALIAAVISHLGALTRSDVPHLRNTQLAFPVAICLAIVYLPALLGVRSMRVRVFAGLAIAVAVVALLPTYLTNPKTVALRLWRPLHARVSPPAQWPLPPGVQLHSVAAARIGPHTLRQRHCCTAPDGIPMADFVAFLNRLHVVVGGRRVFVDKTPGLYAPGITFLADLRPAATPQDFGTMVVNTDVRRAWFRSYRALLPQIRAVVTVNPHRRAARLWARTYPAHRTVLLPFGRRTVHVLLR